MQSGTAKSSGFLLGGVPYSLSARVFYALALTGMLLICGCQVPAQIVWSPDGSQAAYRVDKQSFLLNDQGNVLRPLGESTGGFVWSLDSKSLYFAAVDEDHNPPTPILRDWFEPKDDPATQSTSAPASVARTVTAINLLRDGKVQPLFRLANACVWHLQLSPDGNWLAIVAGINTSDDPQQDQVNNHLFVYSLARNELHLLNYSAGASNLCACFTGSNSLTFAQSNGLDPAGQLTGKLVEVTLGDGISYVLPRRPLLQVILPATGWLEPCANGIFFTAAPATFPGPVTSDDAYPVFKLYHYTCADRALTVLAEDVDTFFDASPDGKRILFERIAHRAPSSTSPSNAPAIAEAELHRELCVMNANGSDPHLLRSLSNDKGNAIMFPAWRGNDQITFIAPDNAAQDTTVEGKSRTVYDVMLYHLTETSTLEPLSKLSASWKPEMKPFQSHDQLTTAPTK